MTMTKKQRRASGLNRPAPLPPAGTLPWKARDILRIMPDGSSELARSAIVDAKGNEIVHDVYSEAHRDRIVAAVNLHRSAGGRLGPKEAYLDPMSILEDSLDILPVVLETYEEANGEKDPVFRDLIKRVKLAMKARPRL